MKRSDKPSTSRTCEFSLKSFKKITKEEMEKVSKLRYMVYIETKYADYFKYEGFVQTSQAVKPSSFLKGVLGGEYSVKVNREPDDVVRGKYVGREIKEREERVEIGEFRDYKFSNHYLEVGKQVAELKKMMEEIGEKVCLIYDGMDKSENTPKRKNKR